MLLDDYPPAVTLSHDTVIGGSTINSILELGYRELFNDMRLEDPFESMHVMYLLEVQKVARECFQEVARNKLDFPARDINLRYALKAAETFMRIYEQLEKHWVKKNSMPSCERVLVSLSPCTTINGTTLRQIMEWAGVQLYLDLKPRNPFQSMLADLVVRTHKTAWDCNEQADWRRHDPDVRATNLNYALKATIVSAQLFARLEAYQTKHIERCHTTVTGRRKLAEVPSGNVAHRCKMTNKAAHVNGNGEHP